MADDDEGRLVGLVGRADGDGAVAGPFDEGSHCFVRRGRWRRCVGVREYGEGEKADEEKSDDKKEGCVWHLVSAIAAVSQRDKRGECNSQPKGQKRRVQEVARENGLGFNWGCFTMTQFRRRCRLAVQL